ncbi:MAG: hypothetical protein ACRD44_12575 [Bryobacteraceae bacterium]
MREPDKPPPPDPAPARRLGGLFWLACAGAIAVVGGAILAVIQPSMLAVWLPLVAGGAVPLAFGLWLGRRKAGSG